MTDDTQAEITRLTLQVTRLEGQLAAANATARHYIRSDVAFYVSVIEAPIKDYVIATWCDDYARCGGDPADIRAIVDKKPVPKDASCA